MMEGDCRDNGRRRMFSKELRCMLYGYGDDKNPYTETVDFLEDLVMEFISEMTHKSMEIGRQGRVQVEDIIFLVRKQPRMYARVRELLTMNEELKKARKAFDEVKYVQGSKRDRGGEVFVCVVLWFCASKTSPSWSVVAVYSV